MNRGTTLVRSTLAAVLLAVPAGVAAASSTASAAPAPYCEIRWGSSVKEAGQYAAASLTSVRTGRHDCFDRLVVDLSGPAAGYVVAYVAEVVRDGSGMPVPLRGGARLEVIVRAPDYDANGQQTYTPADEAELADVAGYRTFRQVAWAGSFEGQSTLGLGVRARLPFRVFTLDGPGSGSRVVVDVAHRW